MIVIDELFRGLGPLPLSFGRDAVYLQRGLYEAIDPVLVLEGQSGVGRVEVKDHVTLGRLEEEGERGTCVMVVLGSFRNFEMHLIDILVSFWEYRLSCYSVNIHKPSSHGV